MPEPLWMTLKRAGLCRAQALLDHFYVVGVPVDPFAIARRLGVQVVYADPTYDCAGAMQILEGTAYIVVRSSDSLVRQRYALSHELGHLMWHEGTVYRDPTFAGRSREEIEANEFAADLLMPLHALHTIFTSHRFPVTQLPEIFQVSREAMNYRLQKIGVLL